MKTLNLTADQLKALNTLAGANGMRFLAMNNQCGIGYAGQLAFEIVYHASEKKGRQWTFRTRNETSLAMARQMREIIG